MIEKYTSRDIDALVEEAKKKVKNSKKKTQKGNFTSDSAITPFVGRGNDKVVITAGFKIKHKASGLSYTVQDVDFQNGDVIMHAVSGDGLALSIPTSEFQQYERL